MSTPISPPSGPTQWLFQGPSAKSKFLAADTDGIWHELTKARFTGDDIARRGYRLDYAGGVKEGTFFMRNGGFFAETVKIGSAFERESTSAKQPVIDLEALEAAK